MTPDLKVVTEARWVADPPSMEVEAQLARLLRTQDVQHVAVMPDVHLGSDACVGSVIATSRLLYPSVVGGDLGCGMAAMRFCGGAAALADRDRAAKILVGLARRVPSSAHRRSTAIPALPDELEATSLSAPSLQALKRRTARTQFGTLGGGNHFIELQTDDEGALWLMLHSGSRGIGQAILERHVARAPRGATGFAFLEADSEAGHAYLADLQWGLCYAEANRRAMTSAAAEVIEDVLGTGRIDDSYATCHHNYIRRETHSVAPRSGVSGANATSTWWVHRKGAISARSGEPGIIPGSMGTASFHVVGRGHPPSLCSSSHGAGRCMSRGEAKRAISVRSFQAEMQSVWFDHRNADRLRDEAPSAYKDIGAVMRAQRELTCIVRRLQPLLSYKGS